MTKQASPPGSALSTAADESTRSHRNPPLRCGLRHERRSAGTPQGERSRLDSLTEYGTALRAQGSHDAATPDSLRSVGCHRWSLHALRYVISLSLRLSYVPSLAGAIGMRGQSLRHTHPFSCLGRTFHSRLAGCAHATAHCCADAQGREVFGKPHEVFNGDESPADPARSASGTSRKAPRAHPSLRDKSLPSRPPRMGAHKEVTMYASPPDSAISNVAAEESARTQRNPSRYYGLRHVRR